MYKWIRCQSHAAHTPRGPSRRAQMHPAGSPASAPPSSVVGLKPARQPQCEYSYDHSYAHSLDPARYRPSLPLHSKERPSTLQSRSKQGGLQPTVTLCLSVRFRTGEAEAERSHSFPFPLPVHPAGLPKAFENSSRPAAFSEGSATVPRRRRRRPRTMVRPHRMVHRVRTFRMD